MIGVARPALEWRPGRIVTGDSSGPIAPPSDTPRLVPKGRRNDQPKIVLALVSYLELNVDLERKWKEKKEKYI